MWLEANTKLVKALCAYCFFMTTSSASEGPKNNFRRKADAPMQDGYCPNVANMLTPKGCPALCPHLPPASTVHYDPWFAWLSDTLPAVSLEPRVQSPTRRSRRPF